MVRLRSRHAFPVVEPLKRDLPPAPRSRTRTGGASVRGAAGFSSGTIMGTRMTCPSTWLPAHTRTRRSCRPRGEREQALALPASRLRPGTLEDLAHRGARVKRNVCSEEYLPRRSTKIPGRPGALGAQIDDLTEERAGGAGDGFGDGARHAARFSMGPEGRLGSVCGAGTRALAANALRRMSYRSPVPHAHHFLTRVSERTTRSPDRLRPLALPRRRDGAVDRPVRPRARGDGAGRPRDRRRREGSLHRRDHAGPLRHRARRGDEHRATPGRLARADRRVHGAPQQDARGDRVRGAGRPAGQATGRRLAPPANPPARAFARGIPGDQWVPAAPLGTAPHRLFQDDRRSRGHPRHPPRHVE